MTAETHVNPLPLVSCLMVTKSGREIFARRAIENFLVQTYSHKQLVIVADTPDAFSGLPKNVKLVRADRGLSLGGLRAQSVNAADGDLIAIWDDDDENDPTRLERQVAALDHDFGCVLSRVTLVCACGFTCPSAPRDQWESTLVARRGGLPFYRDLAHGEDTALIDDIREKHTIASLDNPALYHYHFHGGNASNIEHWQHLFERAGAHHDVWKCTSDRGLTAPEAEEAEDIAKRIREATSPAALARVALAIDRFRARHAAGGPEAQVRARLAYGLGLAFLDQGEAPAAQVWALRALQDGPRVDTFVLLGEIAAAIGEWDQAERWYESAAGTTSRSATDYPLRPVNDRHLELRQYARPLRTVRRQMRNDSEHVLAVMTCRGREKALGRTLLSLVGAGLNAWRGPKVLVSDGGVIPPYLPAVWLIDRTDKMHGQAKTMLRVFEAAATVCPGFTALTLFEDDIVLAKNALDYIATTAIDDDLALISWFTTLNYSAPFSPFLRITSAANHRPTNAGVTFPAATVSAVLDRYYPTNQAITMPASTVRAVLDSGRLHKWPQKHAADEIFLEVPGKPCAIHYPNLVQHVGGTESLVGNVGERISPTFIGEDADALGLR